MLKFHVLAVRVKCTCPELYFLIAYSNSNVTALTLKASVRFTGHGYRLKLLSRVHLVHEDVQENVL